MGDISVGSELLGGEPEVDLVLGRVGSVRTVADVATNVNAEVTADGAGEGVLGVGGTEESAAASDGAEALPAHGDDRARGEVVNETLEEGLGLEVGVVAGGLLLRRLEHLHADELEA